MQLRNTGCNHKLWNRLPLTPPLSMCSRMECCQHLQISRLTVVKNDDSKRGGQKATVPIPAAAATYLLAQPNQPVARGAACKACEKSYSVSLFLLYAYFYKGEIFRAQTQHVSQTIVFRYTACQ
jgi:hypothetical protein